MYVNIVILISNLTWSYVLSVLFVFLDKNICSYCTYT
jgi:hypothetical protein